MKEWRAKALSGAFVLLALSGGVLAQTASKAPPLRLIDLQGRALRLADYKGEVVLLNFWATWCPPCRTEMPELIKWQREYRAQGLQIIGITYPPQRISEVRPFVRSIKVNYPIALGSKATKLLFTSSETLPLSVVIDKEGSIREVIEGIIFPEEFDQKIKPLLSSGTLPPVGKKNVPKQQTPARIYNADVWQPFKYFVGTWKGTGKGEPGASQLEREYKFVLGGKFLNVTHKSIYHPQEKNPKGETHEDWGFFSYDRSRKLHVLRQFHVEGFVTQYVSERIAPDGKTLVFTAESLENLPAGWRARETYRILNNDEFVEVFELAAAGKEFGVYSENHFRRQ